MDANTVVLLAAAIGAIATVVGTLGGTFLGYRLSKRATQEHERLVEKREADAVRTLLTLEIGRN